MTRELTPGDGSRAVAELTVHEARLRALHALRTEARLVDGFEAPYVSFVRTLRERLHPRGVRDIRTISLEDGLTLSVDVGDRLGCDIFYGYYEEAFDARIFTQTLVPGATVVDIGANFGFYTLLAARTSGPAATVLAFEPDPNALSVLKQNVEANGLAERVTAFQMVIGESDGALDLHLAAESAFTSVRPTGRSEMIGTVTVPMRSLDSFAAEHSIGSIDAVKIDAEGFEGPILRGARALLRASTDPLVLLEVSAKNLTDELQSELSEELNGLMADGFLALRPDVRSPQGLCAVQSGTDVAQLTNTNVFLVRAGRETEQRLREVARRQLSEPSALVAVRSTDIDDRELRLYRGLDPSLVADALDERDALRGRVAELEEQQDAARQSEIASSREIDQLRVQMQKLAARAANLSVTQERLNLTALQAEAVIARQSAEVEALRAAHENAKRTIREQAQEIQELQARALTADEALRAAHENAKRTIREQAQEIQKLQARALTDDEALRAVRQECAEEVQRKSVEVILARETLIEVEDMVRRQQAELQQLRLANEMAQAQLDDWRSLAERLVTESDDRREQLEAAQRHIHEKRELIDQLWAKLAAARSDRDMLQARCTEQMHEIWRLREEQQLGQQGEEAANPTRRLG